MTKPLVPRPTSVGGFGVAGVESSSPQLKTVGSLCSTTATRHWKIDVALGTPGRAAKKPTLAGFCRSPHGPGGMAIGLAVLLLALWSTSGLSAQDSRGAGNRRGAQPSGKEWRSADRAQQGAPPVRPTPPQERRYQTEDKDEVVRPGVGGIEAARLTGSGQVWRDYDLATYSTRLAAVPRVEQSVVGWILHETGEETWHGEELAVLSATRSRLRVLHSPEVQDRVAEIVERFVHPVQWQVSMRFDFLSSSDLTWRTGLLHLLRPVATGPEGQQVWLIAPEDASLIRQRLRADRQLRTLGQRRILVQNGQPTTVEVGQAVNFISGLELMPGAYLAYQPVLSRLTEGIKLSAQPLWLPDGSGVDLRLKLSTEAIARLHDARGAAPLTTGNQTAEVQVPEVAGTKLDAELRWPSSQVLLISAGVQPGILRPKRGVLALPGLASTAELLILAELDPPGAARSASRPSTP